MEHTRLPKMGPAAGRSVLVNGDVAQAFMKLRTIIAQNKVRSDFAAQKFHEAPSVKRKRLASLRHRRRFKEGFKRMVAVVMDMKKKGCFTRYTTELPTTFLGRQIVASK